MTRKMKIHKLIKFLKQKKNKKNMIVSMQIYFIIHIKYYKYKYWRLIYFYDSN